MVSVTVSPELKTRAWLFTTEIGLHVVELTHFLKLFQLSLQTITVKKKGNWEQSNKKILCLIVRLVFIEGKLGLITGQQSIGHCIIHAMNTPEKLLSFLEYVYSAKKPTISRGVLRALDIMKGSTGQLYCFHDRWSLVDCWRMLSFFVFSIVYISDLFLTQERDTQVCC